ncbi:MAG TPA: ABC transporter permease subunit [Trebonia sp.]|nr:ABC transporter permease subunit [Trebonia sp.]
MATVYSSPGDGATLASRLAPGGGAGRGRRRDGRRRERAPGARRALWERIGYGIAGTLGFLVIAQLVSVTGLVKEEYLPPAFTVLAHAAQLGGNSAFLGDVGSTLLAWALALAIACLIAVPLGIVVAVSKVSQKAAGSLISLLRPVPAVALLPPAVLVWGNGLRMKLILAVFGIVWPILFNTMHGVRDVDPVAKESAHSYGIHGFRLLRHVILPSAAPFILTGVRVAASLAFVVIVGTELFAGANSGIGAYILAVSTGGGDTTTMIAAAVWAGAIGLLINVGLSYCDRRCFRWARRGEAA